jgi:hypothetical protein
MTSEVMEGLAGIAVVNRFSMTVSSRLDQGVPCSNPFERFAMLRAAFIVTLARNRLRGDVPQPDLTNDVMDQKVTSGQSR